MMVIPQLNYVACAFQEYTTGLIWKNSSTTKVPVRTYCRHVVLGVQLTKAVLLNQNWHWPLTTCKPGQRTTHSSRAHCSIHDPLTFAWHQSGPEWPHDTYLSYWFLFFLTFALAYIALFFLIILIFLHETTPSFICEYSSCARNLQRVPD